jgi:hypothetical protein
LQCSSFRLIQPSSLTALRRGWGVDAEVKNQHSICLLPTSCLLITFQVQMQTFSGFEQWSISGSSQRTWTNLGFPWVFPNSFGFPWNLIPGSQFRGPSYLVDQSMPSDCSSNSSRGGYTSSASKSCRNMLDKFWAKHGQLEENMRNKWGLKRQMGISPTQLILLDRGIKTWQFRIWINNNFGFSTSKREQDIRHLGHKAWQERGLGEWEMNYEVVYLREKNIELTCHSMLLSIVNCLYCFWMPK